ncbi:SAC3 family protein 1 [Choanephora cucurbitarum]|uniref:SAC3 family protein 1 n=1 Tax=Choanephora cucurbitarum TaxID=101091 RepID=A0A1C7MVC8_9FUNG|nr:SAC3 family protein 1 [Choanephora cucurbitarum]
MMFNAQRGRGRGSVFGSPHDSVQQQPIQFFQTSTFQTPNNSAFQKPNNQASVFSTSNHSAFQASNHQASAFQLPTQSAFQPPTQSAFQPSTASTFQASNNASSRFAFQQQQQPSSAFRAPKNNTKRNQFDASLNEALGQSNPSSFSLGQPEKPRFEPKKKTKQKPMEPMLDESRVTAADRAQRFGATNKSAEYDRMKKSRVHERQQAIDRGLIPDPNAPVRLEDAIDFRGTCETKCPDFEILEREIQNGLDSLEMDAYGNADKHKVVKAYRRSAAGNEQPLPSDVRTPESLVSTLDYLVDEVLSQQPLEKCHAFIRDRTRSIRQDFTLQNIRDITAVQVHERIARFHILCLHEMCGLDESKFSEQQETEQLRKGK